MTTGVRCARSPVTALSLLKLLVVAEMDSVPPRAKAVFVAKDRAITKSSGTDPADIHATLDVAYDSERGEFQMPAGGSWLVNKDTVAKYVNRTAPMTGAVRLSVIKSGLLVKVVGKSLGDTPLDVSTPPSGPVYVAYGVVNAGEELWHCVQFEGCVHRAIAGGTGCKLVCRGSSIGDAACTAAIRGAKTTSS